MSAATIKPEVWKLGEVVSRGFGQWVEIDVVGGHGGFAEAVWRMEDEDVSPHCEARAKVLVAAPVLLVALTDALEQAPHADGCRWWEISAKEQSSPEGRAMANSMCNCWRKDAHAAIAKATGAAS